MSTVGSAGSGIYTFAGGFVGDVDNGGSVSSAYSLSPVASSAGVSFVGGFAGYVGTGAVSQVYASGHVSGDYVLGGLVGILQTGGSFSDSYWDEGATGLTYASCCASGTLSNDEGIGGSTGISPYAASTYTNFDLTSSGSWVIFDGSTRPMLRMEYSTTITNGHQLQLMALDPSANYTLANNIDLSATSANTDVWNPASGFVPVGGNNQADFTGTFEGNGHTLSNLAINYNTVTTDSADGFTGQGDAGLFGIVGTGGVLKDVNLANVNVTAGDGMSAGALAGAIEDGQALNDSSSGSVTGGANAGAASAQPAIGGLIGAATDSSVIANSNSSATVTGGDSESAGGLVGSILTGSSIAGSYATGAVSTGSDTQFTSLAGGLVGSAYGFDSGGVNPSAVTISGSYATGQVSGGAGSDVGGFAGALGNTEVADAYATGAVTQPSGDGGGFAGAIYSGSTIADSYATGQVTQTTGGANKANDLVGGFAGFIGASQVSQSYASGAVNTQGGLDSATYTLAGGFVGDVDNGGSVTNSYALSPVSSGGSGYNFLGGFVGYLNASVSQVYAVGHVSGAGLLGGLAGTANVSGLLTDSYWDEGTTGLTYASCCVAGTLSNDEGIGGSTGISLYAASTYANFDLTSSGPWVIFDGSTRPLLRMEASTTITNGHQLQLMALDPSANYTLANNIDLTVTSTDTDVWNPATGFVPVGGNAQANFTGIFEGNGFTLSNLFINDSTDVAQATASGFTTDGAVGLFGTIGADGQARDVSLTNANVNGVGGMVVGRARRRGLRRGHQRHLVRHGVDGVERRRLRADGGGWRSGWTGRVRRSAVRLQFVGERLRRCRWGGRRLGRRPRQRWLAHRCVGQRRSQRRWRQQRHLLNCRRSRGVGVRLYGSKRNWLGSDDHHGRLGERRCLRSRRIDHRRSGRHHSERPDFGVRGHGRGVPDQRQLDPAQFRRWLRGRY